MITDLGAGPGDCILCGEVVTWAEAGFYASASPLHAECGTRSALGGIGHIEDHALWCLQRGDPDGGRTYRQSAREVVDWMLRGQVG